MVPATLQYTIENNTAEPNSLYGRWTQFSMLGYSDWLTPAVFRARVCACVPVCALPSNDTISAPLTSHQTGNGDLSPICPLVLPRVVQLAHLLSALCALVCVRALAWRSRDATFTNWHTQMDGGSEDGRVLIASQNHVEKVGKNLVIFLNACCCNHRHI